MISSFISIGSATSVWSRRSKRSARHRADIADALRALSALLRSGLSPRIALHRWHRHAPQSFAVPLLELQQRLRLGADAGRALQALEPSLGADVRVLACLFEVHGRLGGDLASMVDRLAGAADERAEAVAAGKASGAGALLSGRIVAGLPALLLPLAPLAQSPLLDALGVFMVLAGGALAIVGMTWVGRLVPVPPTTDPDGVIVAEVLACALDGGASLYSALHVAGEHVPGEVGRLLLDARRIVRLGMSWPDALDRMPNGSLRAISGELRLAMKLGTPVSAALRRWSNSQRSEARRAFDAAMRRAPVLMVVPLSICVLPAYALLGLGPYVRGLL